MEEFPIYMEPGDWKQKFRGTSESELWEILQFLRDEGIITWDQDLFEEDEIMAVGPAGLETNDG